MVSILDYGAMNGGKTKSSNSRLELKSHEGVNTRRYTSTRNEREEPGIIAVNEIEKYPAVPATSAQDIIDDLERVTETLFSAQIRYRGRNGLVGVETRLKPGLGKRSPIRTEKMCKDVPIGGIMIDENQFFVLTEEEALMFIDLLQYCRRNGIDVYSSALLSDYRQEAFGFMRTIFDYFDEHSRVAPRCKRIKPLRRGERPRQCGERAYHSQKLWYMKRVPRDLRDHMEIAPIFDFVDKDHTQIFGEYLVSPSFSPTVDSAKPSRTKKGKKQRWLVMYVPVCHDCFITPPFKEETHELYQRICRGQTRIRRQDALTKAMLEFLVKEPVPLVRAVGKEIFEAIPYRKGYLGKYQPDGF